MKRVLAVLAAAGLATLGLAAPAAAHGALATPASRAYMCGAGTAAQRASAACRAAVAAGADVQDWDDIRVPNVDGRDRQVVPDGRLCGGGLDGYRGLDLPRTDWPTTRLTAGAAFTFVYQERIPHKGTFRIYVTKAGYDPSRALRWSDLEAQPFLTAKDPAMQDGAYRMTGTLPKRSGRQVIYTIWQTSSTPDTYYSCSDVVFGAAKAPAGTKSAPGATPAPSKPASGRTGQTGQAAQAALEGAEPTPSLVPRAATTTSGTDTGFLIAVVGVAIALVAAGSTVVMRRRQR